MEKERNEDDVASPALATSSTLPATKEPEETTKSSPFLNQFNHSKPSTTRYLYPIERYGRLGPGTDATPPNDPAHSIPVADDFVFDKLRPPAPSPLFTGRTKELGYMHTFFHQNHEGELILRGVPGSGKTQLALKFAETTTLHR